MSWRTRAELEAAAYELDVQADALDKIVDQHGASTPGYDSGIWFAAQHLRMRADRLREMVITGGSDDVNGWVS